MSVGSVRDTTDSLAIENDGMADHHFNIRRTNVEFDNGPILKRLKQPRAIVADVCLGVVPIAWLMTVLSADA